MAQTPTGSTGGTAPEEWLKVPDVARELGIPKSRAYDLVAKGDLPGVRVGRRTIRIPRSQLTRFLLEQRPARRDITDHE
jgi:excisionase family DNA binding protein